MCMQVHEVYHFAFYHGLQSTRAIHVSFILQVDPPADHIGECFWKLAWLALPQPLLQTLHAGTTHVDRPLTSGDLRSLVSIWQSPTLIGSFQGLVLSKTVISRDINWL